MKQFIQKNLKWIMIVVSLLCFLFLTTLVLQKEILRFDIICYQYISDYLISGFLTPVAKIITIFGGPLVLVTVSVLLLGILKNKKIGLCILVNLGLVFLLNLILKNIVQRPRPMKFSMINETGYSFPSGHSMVSVAFYGFLIYLIYKYWKNKRAKRVCIGLLVLLIILIGTSRIYLGVHYTSDVLAGFMCALVYLLIYIGVVDKLILESDQKNEKVNL